MDIVVAGTARCTVAPERATVHARVSFEAAVKAEALARATEQANALGSALRALQSTEASPVESVAVLPISTRQWHPHADDGRVLPLRHLAEALTRVTFSDFPALTSFIDQWGSADGITIDWVEWTLTPESRSREEGAVLERAVGHARERATAMAHASGSGEVRCVEVADAGLLSPGAPAMAYEMAPMSMKRSGGGDGGGVDLSPADIELSATVHARFTTD